MSVALKNENRKTLLKPFNIYLKHHEEPLCISKQKYMLANPSLPSMYIGLRPNILLELFMVAYFIELFQIKVL